jgi:dTDP-4-dehydrorhamnose reductase
MRLLIIGNTGQVGWELERILQGCGEIVAMDYPAVDLTDHTRLRALVRDMKPRIIFNAAAYTAVDKAESEPDRAKAINTVAPGVLAETAKSIGAGLIHYSTDYVYDGTKEGLYVESDTPNPQSVYGRTKAEGDAAIAANGSEYAILRTSWVFGSRGANFVLTMLRLGKERSEMRIVDDQVGSPTWCRNIAQTSVQFAEQMTAGEFPSGVYHTTNSGYTSWFGFAQEIFKQREARTGAATPKLIPIKTEEYPLPAPRPRNSRLSNEKLVGQIGKRLPSWQDALHAVMNELPEDRLR